MTEFKLLLCGDQGVGKTTFVERHSTGAFIREHTPTTPNVVKPLSFATNKGNVVFQICENPDLERFDGSDGAIVMFDTSKQESFPHALDRIDEIRRVMGNIPIVLCGNKIENYVFILNIRVVLNDYPNVQYYDISAKTNYQFDKPFLHLGRKLMGEDFNFVEFPPIATNFYV